MPTYAAAAILIATLAQPTSDPRPTNPDAYQVLIGEELAGSGFVTRHRGRLWGVMSIHQFDGRTPSRLEQLEGEPSQILLQREGALRQTDVQAFPLKDQATAVPFLAYDPAFTLVGGAALLILGPAGEAVPAKLGAAGERRCSQGSKRLTAYPERPFTAAGGSGAPVLLKSTGTVIGVLLSADDPKAARRVELETLCLPDTASTVSSEALSLNTVAGRWTLDLAYAHEIWKQEKGAAYDAGEWTRLTSSRDSVNADEVRLDEGSVSFYKDGAKSINHPVLGWTVENDVVWVRARHFSGAELTMGFVPQGNRLKIIRRDGTWLWLSAFQRAEPARDTVSLSRGRAVAVMVVGAILALVLGVSAVVVLVVLLAKGRSRRGASGAQR